MIQFSPFLTCEGCQRSVSRMAGGLLGSQAGRGAAVEALVQLLRAAHARVCSPHVETAPCWNT